MFEFTSNGHFTHALFAIQAALLSLVAKQPGMNCTLVAAATNTSITSPGDSCMVRCRLDLVVHAARRGAT